MAVTTSRPGATTSVARARSGWLTLVLTILNRGAFWWESRNRSSPWISNATTASLASNSLRQATFGLSRSRRGAM